MKPSSNPREPGLDVEKAEPPGSWSSQAETTLPVEMLKQRLYQQLIPVLVHLFPLGKLCPPHFVVGNLQGQPGESLKVELRGPKIGLWHDFTTGEGGDILSLWGAVHGWDGRHHFPQILHSIQEWLGDVLPASSPQQPLGGDQEQPSVLLASGWGTPTGEWAYEDAQGTLLARVYRYDTPTGKQYRPWDAKTRRYKAPDPRPLYNQRGMAHAETILIVEGEKCAQALIDCGLCATTAMNGAQAPLAKTDWSPLKGKHIILWPDHDKVGQAYMASLGQYLSAVEVASLAQVRAPGSQRQKILTRPLALKTALGKGQNHDP